LMRTLAIDHTHDPKVYDGRFHNQYCSGPSFLIVPFESKQAYAPVYLPEGQWYDLYTDSVEQGGREKMLTLSIQQLPVFVKESSIVPMQTLIQNTTEKPADTLFLHVYQGKVKNEFVYYEDDGETYAYEKGAFYKRRMIYDPAARAITLEKAAGQSSSRFSVISL